MTRIEKVVREISDLRDFWLKIRGVRVPGEKKQKPESKSSPGKKTGNRG